MVKKTPHTIRVNILLKRSTDLLRKEYRQYIELAMNLQIVQYHLHRLYRVRTAGVQVQIPEVHQMLLEVGLSFNCLGPPIGFRDKI